MPLSNAERLILPITRIEMPGWGWLYRRVSPSGAVASDADRVPQIQTIRGKWHGYQMCLDLKRWSERHTFFLGRYYDLGTQLVLRQFIEPSDRFVDIGANIGMITLLAARLVGPEGRVDCFEPNPRCLTRLREHITINALEHVRVHPYALATRRVRPS